MRFSAQFSHSSDLNYTCDELRYVFKDFFKYGPCEIETTSIPFPLLSTRRGKVSVFFHFVLAEQPVEHCRRRGWYCDLPIGA